MRLRLVLLLACGASAAAPAADVVSKRVGRLTIQVHTEDAHPGGLFDVRLLSDRHLGVIRVFFEGRATPAFGPPGRLRALVPIPLSSGPGRVTLGIELRARRRPQRMRIDAAVSPREYRTLDVELAAAARGLLAASQAIPDGRRLMLLMRTLSDEAHWGEGFAAPLRTPHANDFGARLRYSVSEPVARSIDGTWGERQRGLTFAAPVRSAVHAPAGGVVLFAGRLTLSGQTLVIDHGQGLVSSLRHLSRLDVTEGERVARGDRIALSGATGLTPEPALHWSLFLHGIAVDPEILAATLGEGLGAVSGRR